jgi:hypothetical protein
LSSWFRLENYLKIFKRRLNIMKILKISIIVIHIVLGLILIFMLDSPLNIFYKVGNPDSFYPDYSVSYIVVETLIGIIIGLLSIGGAIAFIKDKKWAMYALPLIILMLIIRVIFYVMATPSTNFGGVIKGIALVFAFIMFILFVLESIYMGILIRRIQSK